MRKPIERHYNEKNDTTVLFFSETEEGNEYYVRGGICFPITFERAGVRDVQGCALLGGQDVRTKIITIFEQIEFVTIDNIIDDKTQMIEYYGLGSWLNKAWARYYARKFFYNQPFETAKKYRLEIIRSKMINPKPYLISVPFIDDDEAHHVIWKQVKTKRIKMKEGSILHEQLGVVKGGDKQMLPAVYALACLLIGIERFPYRKKD